MIDDSDSLTTYCNCDGCGLCKGVLMQKGADELRDLLLKEGWTTDGARDYCPDCKGKLGTGHD